MRLIAGIGGVAGLVAGLSIVGSSAQSVRTLPPNAEAVIARTGIVPVGSQNNPVGMAIGGLLAIGGLGAIGYSMLSGDDADQPVARVVVQQARSAPAPTPIAPVESSPAPTPETPIAPELPEPSDGGAVRLDLVTAMMQLSQFCHVLIAGENGTGKTTLVMQLLKQIITKFAQNPEFDLLIIDPKLSRWGGLYESPNYQAAFPDADRDLIESVDRLEAFYRRLQKRAKLRQSKNVRAVAPILAVIDEVNTYLDALEQLDRKMIQSNRSSKPADREPFLSLHSSAKSAILGIGRMGREDKVWLWLLGQNPNLSALGFDGAADRANFTVVAVGCGDNQIGLDLALSNAKMFPAGAKLRPLLETHQGNPYQLAACSRYPKNLLIMPTSYQQVMAGDLPQPILDRFKCGPTVADPWGADNVVSFAR
jgi:hypothetical protein